MYYDNNLIMIGTQDQEQLYGHVKEELTYPNDHTPLPPKWLVEALVENEKEMEPFIPTGEAVFNLLKDIKTYDLKRGNFRMDTTPEIYYYPKQKYRPIHKLEKVGSDRVKRIKTIIDDLKAEGVDRFIPQGVDKEKALLNFATLSDYKQQLAQLLTGMSPWKRDETLADLKVWPDLLKKLDTSPDHDYGLLPRVSQNEEPALERYYSGGRELCQRIGVIQQLEKITVKSGMPTLQDSELTHINSWLKVKLYEPIPSTTPKSQPVTRSWRENPGRR